MNVTFPKALIMNFNSGKKNPKKDENSLSWIILRAKLGFRKKMMKKLLLELGVGAMIFHFNPLASYERQPAS